jgi:lipoprotein-releasing system permease protein
MNLAAKIAWRYFRGKKSAQAINIISWISISAIAVSAGAMTVLFSIFNGLEGTVLDMYSAFYPDIKVTAAKGKFFKLSPAQKRNIEKINGIALASYTIEDMVLLSGNDEQKVGTLKGVDQHWFDVSNMDSFIIEGSGRLKQNKAYTPAVVGLNIAAALGVDVNNVFSAINVYYPKPGVRSLSMQDESSLNSIILKPDGVFRIQDEFDSKYILTTIVAAQYLFGRENKLTSVELKMKTGANTAAIKKELRRLLGDKVLVDDRFEQNKTLYMVMRSEKWAVYAILLLVLLIASFNMIGSLSMVVLEKKKDMVILKSMGATQRLIHWVFLLEGCFLALLGGGLGVGLGLLLCLGQQHFGWVALPDGFIINAYPVELRFADFLLVAGTVLVVGILAAWYPARKAALQPLVLREG